MRSFFRACEKEGVRYLLISGQASVLYGAAAFSEDVDVWVDPAPSNARRCRNALRRAGARAYKLTPPFTHGLLRGGHGFHFTLADPVPPAYLDVMGRPPRVGRFDPALRRARWLPTPWGRIPVVSIEDLVELKKTRRLQDYDTITHLVRIRLEVHRDWRGPVPPARLLRWAAGNLFRAEDLLWLLDTVPESRRIAAALGRPAVRCLLRRPSLRVCRAERDLARCRRALAAEVARLQHADVRYWAPILSALRRLRAAGRLMQVGARV